MTKVKIRKVRAFFGLIVLAGLLASVVFLFVRCNGDGYGGAGEENETAQSLETDQPVVNQGIPLFLQGDRRWRDQIYGDDRMELTGCGPTCLAMVRCGLGHDTRWTPDQVAEVAERDGYYAKGKGSVWTLMSEGAGEFGLSVDKVVFDAAHIIQTLQNGHPIICAMGPGDFTTEGHFIVLAGVDEASGEVLVNDPNSRENSIRTWDVERIMGQTKNLWCYSLS